MAFWGVEVKPGKPHIHRFDNMRGRLHISQATLGIGSSMKKCMVQCNVGDKSPVLLCALLPDKTESCPMDLEFEEEDEVVFSVIGPRSIHLTGFYLGNSQNPHQCDHDTDSYGEDIGESETEESSDYDSEDEYEDDFIDDDDLDMFHPSSVPNSGVVIEEIIEDEKPKILNDSSKAGLSSGQDGDGCQKKIVIESSNSIPVLESEDEDGFPISSYSKSKPNENTHTKVEEKTSKKKTKEGKKKKAQDDGDQVTSLKRKIDMVVEDGELESRVADEPQDPSGASTEIGPENGVKPKKKKKERVKGEKSLEAKEDDKNNAHKDEKFQPEEKKTDNMDQDLPERAEAEQNLQDEKNADENLSEDKKKKKKKKKKTKENGINAKTEESIVETEDKITEAKPSQVRTFPNGLVIEELVMGKPEGKRASPGKKVAVHYIGKLKNGQIFDSNIGRAPFKFRLGVGHVIKGWDVGVNGMRVGDKRRLTVPPPMGYGSKGAGGKIPPNSWLIFEVELVEVH